MNDYSANFYHLEEGTLANKVVDSEEPSKINPLYVAGRVAGYAAKRVKQGFDSSYKKQKATNEETSTPDGSANDGVALGVGLGKPHADGNHLYKIPVNDYDDSDATFVGDGEEKETSKINIPAILAAKQAGGEPDPKTVENGINKQFKASLDPAMTDDNKNLKEAFGKPNTFIHQFVNHNGKQGTGGLNKMFTSAKRDAEDKAKYVLRNLKNQYTRGMKKGSN